MSYFVAAFDNFKDLLETLSYIVSITGIILIFIEFKKFGKENSEKEKRSKIEVVSKSIDVLKSFAEIVIPDIEKSSREFYDKYREEKDEALRQLNEQLEDENKIEKLPNNRELKEKILIQAKSKSGYGKILNKLEQLSIYMNYDLVDDDLVYGSVHKVFLEFCEQNMDYINYIKSDEAPYENVIKLVVKWKYKREKINLDKDKEKLELRRKKLDND